MTRRLPWLKNTPNTSKRGGKDERPSKRLKVSDLYSSDISEPASPLRKRHVGKLAQARTPSTSPPPEPPKEEPMIEGFDHDDIYIMVEDELLSIAKEFTQHLHHAEYVRMKQEAEARERSAVGSLSRPTDIRALMSEELKRRKQAQAREKAQKGVVGELMKSVGEGQDALEDSDGDDEDQDNDPWVGTSLQGLMSNTRDPRPSLTRLANVKSGSRAAAGFSRSESNLSTQTHLGQQQADSAPRSTGKLPNPGDDDVATTDDDLDLPKEKKVVVSKAPPAKPPSGVESWKRTNVHTTATRNHLPLNKSSSGTRATSTIKVEEEPSKADPATASSLWGRNRSDLKNPKPEPSFSEYTITPSALSTPLSRRRRLRDKAAGSEAQGTHVKEEEQKKRSTQLNEIPTFLI